MNNLEEIMRQPAFLSPLLENMKAQFNAIYGFDCRERRMLDHNILHHDEPVVQHAMRELGKEEVRRISFNHEFEVVLRSKPDQYYSSLKLRLADVYLADTSKKYLRQYADHKFGADLGL